MKNKNQKKIRNKGFLDYSWNIEYRLKNIECTKELKDEIIDYIELSKNRYTGKPMLYSNLTYRGNLHYIEDNIDRPGLIEELRKINEILKKDS